MDPVDKLIEMASNMFTVTGLPETFSERYFKEQLHKGNINFLNRALDEMFKDEDALTGIFKDEYEDPEDIFENENEQAFLDAADDFYMRRI